MAQDKVEALRMECDACGATQLVEAGVDQPNGITVTWVEMTPSGGDGGTFWACREVCAVRALRRRHEIAEVVRGSG